MKIEFTVEEAQVTVNLIDSAIRAGGYRVAPAACSLIEKIAAAVQAEGAQLQDGAPPVEGNGAPPVTQPPPAQVQPAAS